MHVTARRKASGTRVANGWGQRTRPKRSAAYGASQSAETESERTSRGCICVWSYMQEGEEAENVGVNASACAFNMYAWQRYGVCALVNRTWKKHVNMSVKAWQKDYAARSALCMG
jgi:hypothetical protein